MPTKNVCGMDVYYELSGHGNPVLFISGITADHSIWKLFQLAAFTSAGYSCLLFDNRDVGRTGESPTDTYTISQFVEDTVGLMDTVGLEPPHVVGYSMGGMIAQEMALSYPKRIRSLTLLSTAPRADAYLAALLASLKVAKRSLNREDFLLTLGLRVFTHRFFANLDAVKTWMSTALANPYPQSVAGFVRQADAILNHDTLGRLGSIAVPTHVIVGDEDILTPSRHSHVLAEQIPGARLTVIPEAGHVAFTEKAADFNRHALEFLSQH